MNYTRRPYRSSSHAFTLIELLTVIAIIGILAAILFPAIRSARKSAATSRALTNVKQIGMANLLYSQENKSQILGWDIDGSEPLSFPVLKNVARYLVQQNFKYQNYNASERDLTKSLVDYVDPLVPVQFQNYNTTPWTWAFNRIVNTNYGRQSEWSQLGISGVAEKTPRRFSEFRNPSKTIFVLSGNYEIQPTTFDIPPLANPDDIKTRGEHPIFYYHKSKNSTPAVFLDGHSELLTYPISKSLLNPGLPR